MTTSFFEQVNNQAQFFKLLSDPTRLALLALLQSGEARCVCDLVDALDIPQPTVSRHLSKLKAAGLVRAERRGTWMWYAMREDIDANWQQILQLAVA